MSFNHSKEFLQDVRKNISTSLAKTMDIMLSTPIALNTDKDQNQKMVEAYVDLTYQQNTSYLAVAMDETAVRRLCTRIHNEANAAPDILNDAVREIVNIVGNHLRTHFCDDLGYNCGVSLPKNGAPHPLNGYKKALETQFHTPHHEAIRITLHVPTEPT